MKKVLVVNNDDQSTLVLSSALKQNGYAVNHSRTSNDALPLYDQLNPDIVIFHKYDAETDKAGAAKMILKSKLDHAAFIFVSEIIANHETSKWNKRCDVIGRKHAVYPKPIKVAKLLKEIKRW